MLLPKSVTKDLKDCRTASCSCPSPRFPALGSLNKSGTPLKASCRGCAPSPRPAIEDPEGCWARTPSSSKRRTPGRTGTDIAVRSSSIKASNRRSATPISRPPLLLFSPPPPVPPPRPRRSGPHGLYLHVAPLHQVHHLPVLEFDRLKVDIAIAHRLLGS